MNKYTLNSNISITNKKKVKVFSLILLLTTIIWLIMELSKIYTTEITVNVAYQNLPKSKLFQTQPERQLKAFIKAPGFSLLKFNILKPKFTIDLSAPSKSATSYYVIPNQQVASFNKFFSQNIEMLSVNKDTLFLDLGEKLTKRVPVISNVNINFKLGYNLINPLKITPDSVTISGPERFVDSINEVQTEPISLKDVYSNIDINTSLKNNNSFKNVLFDIHKVSIKGSVDKFTEGNFTIPVSIINVPSGISVIPIPDKIEVVYQAGLSNFSKISKNSVSIVYDYEQFKRDSLSRFLTPVIQYKSELISSLKIHPNQIEFFIQK